MKEKEKAIELMSKYINLNEDEYLTKRQNAKECALIAVNELIQNEDDREQSNINYWIEVKQEIEKL